MTSTPKNIINHKKPKTVLIELTPDFPLAPV